STIVGAGGVVEELHEVKNVRDLPNGDVLQIIKEESLRPLSSTSGLDSLESGEAGPEGAETKVSASDSVEGRSDQETPNQQPKSVSRSEGSEGDRVEETEGTRENRQTSNQPKNVLRNGPEGGGVEDVDAAAHSEERKDAPQTMKLFRSSSCTKITKSLDQLKKEFADSLRNHQQAKVSKHHPFVDVYTSSLFVHWSYLLALTSDEENSDDGQVTEDGPKIVSSKAFVTPSFPPPMPPVAAHSSPKDLWKKFAKKSTALKKPAQPHSDNDELTGTPRGRPVMRFRIQESPTKRTKSAGSKFRTETSPAGSSSKAKWPGASKSKEEPSVSFGPIKGKAKANEWPCISKSKMEEVRSQSPAPPPLPPQKSLPLMQRSLPTLPPRFPALPRPLPPRRKHEQQLRKDFDESDSSDAQILRVIESYCLPPTAVASSLPAMRTSQQLPASARESGISVGMELGEMRAQLFSMKRHLVDLARNQRHLVSLLTTKHPENRWVSSDAVFDQLLGKS
ncbi:unnamed protein product, partial [Cyprideis torosa]